MKYAEADRETRTFWHTASRLPMIGIYILVAMIQR